MCESGIELPIPPRRSPELVFVPTFHPGIDNNVGLSRYLLKKDCHGPLGSFGTFSEVPRVS